ncbi:related to integral membrane protein [Ramularia collo-cygni]|uniref:Related to integral membrane protein n=1 Tax=Ramularia collo-cygni TaxID=112498 RepID=A0A2D3UUV9_9PEZI|nr:related to integral membrane protein [Ramularia collo-cygni]CZT21442.1 related to integral membrane protein [Ramularia collo-cygni]
MPASGHASGEAVVGVTISFTVLAGLATVARLVTRIGIVHSAGLDDLVISIAIVLSIMLTIAMCQQVKYGMGRHADSLSVEDHVQSLVWFWASVWVYYLALCFAKLSILIQYLRLFPERKFRAKCFLLIGIVIGWTMFAFFSAVFACRPIRYFWDSSIQGSCLDRLAVWFANTAVNILTDICTAVLPLPVLKSLNLPKKQRFMLMAVFGLGAVTCIISILRLPALYAVSKTKDTSWDNPLAAIWSSLEVNSGIICSCLPTLNGCISRYFPQLFASSDGSNRLTPPVELSRSAKSTICRISANCSQLSKASGRLGRRFIGGDLKLAEEGSLEVMSEDQSTPPSSPGCHIHVATVVEQEEEFRKG